MIHVRVFSPFKYIYTFFVASLCAKLTFCCNFVVRFVYISIDFSLKVARACSLGSLTVAL